jgi:glycosyltransferase involved in cell wall biosynthesis
MSNTTSVTVVIPTFNEEANIAQLTRQILNEPWNNPLVLDEIIIVDDCSGDNTQAITERLARDHERVRVIRHAERGGKNAGMRTGIAACRSEIVVFVDADLRLGDRCVTKTAQLLVGDSRAAISSCIIEPLPPRSWRERAARCQALLVAELKRCGHGYMSAVYAIRMSALEGLTLPDTVADDAYIMGWLRERGYGYTVRTDATAFIRSSMGLRDFAKQTLRGRSGEVAARQAWPGVSIVADRRRIWTRVIVRTLMRDQLGFALYVAWYGLIKITPTKLWLPVVDVSKYDTSASTKDLGC